MKLEDYNIEELTNTFYEVEEFAEINEGNIDQELQEIIDTQKEKIIDLVIQKRIILESDEGTSDLSSASISF